MKLKLIRSVFNPASTMGKLFIDDAFYAFTCEDAVRQMNADCSKKIKNETAIDRGTYEVVLSFSDHFQKFLPLLLNVKCFEGIRIHGGNTAEDSEGCILIGAEGDMKGRVSNCKAKVDELVNLLKTTNATTKIFIEIVEE